MPRQKEKHKSKKYFSRNTPPSYQIRSFLLEKNIKSIVHLFLRKCPKSIVHPRNFLEPRMGGEPLISIKLGGAKIFQTHCCLPHFRPIARNQDASQYVCEFRPVVPDQDVSQDPYQSAPPQTPRMHPSQQFYSELWARTHPRTDPKIRTHPFVQFAQNQHTY